MRKPDEPRRIALLMPRATVHTRGILRGVTRYARPFRAWNFHLGLPHAEALKHLRQWEPAGIIASITDARLEARVAKLGIPLINCSSDLAGEKVDRIITDNDAVGTLAAEYFLDRGYKHFAYCGEPNSLASQARFAAFEQRVTREAVIVIHYIHRQPSFMVGEAGWSVSSRDAALQRWVSQLPKPCALFVCHDMMAMLLSEVCREIDIQIPEQLAILGVDNDATLCEMAYPSLSSIQTAQEQIGFAAARRLDAQMQNPDAPLQTTRLAPLGVVARQSTDVLVADDPLVAAAMRYIQQHADQPIRVDDVVEHVGGSRRALEYRFKSATGQSILSRIQQTHIDLANELLISTTLPLDAIARACGFNSRERFSAVYRQITGRTPRSTQPDKTSPANIQHRV